MFWEMHPQDELTTADEQRKIALAVEAHDRKTLRHRWGDWMLLVTA
jgi:hypothetical protein